MAAVVEKLLEKDKNLNEETNYLWARTLDGSFDFDRRAQEAAAVKTLDKVKRKGGFLHLLKKFANKCNRLTTTRHHVFADCTPPLRLCNPLSLLTPYPSFFYFCSPRL